MVGLICFDTKSKNIFYYSDYPNLKKTLEEISANIDNVEELKTRQQIAELKKYGVLKPKNNYCAVRVRCDFFINMMVDIANKHAKPLFKKGVR